MIKEEITQSLVDKYQYGISSLPFVLDFIKENFSHLQIQSVSPYSFVIGSSNNGEPISYEIENPNALFFGNLYLNISPNENMLQDEVIKLRYRSYWNKIPFFKHINRVVESENYMNENSSSDELFDRIELLQSSTKYDLYVTFVGFKIDVR